MTTSVYIRGNVADPINVHIYDADTGILVPGVTRIELVADTNSPTSAILCRRVGYADIHVDVVPGPPDPLAGKKVVAFSMESKHSSKMCAALQYARAEEYTVQDDGTLGAASVNENSDGVTDMELASYAGADPLTPIIDSMKAAMRGLAALVTQDIIATALANIIQARNAPIKVNPAGITKTPPTCDECKGTGLYTGLHTTEPCSKGCPQP